MARRKHDTPSTPTLPSVTTPEPQESHPTPVNGLRLLEPAEPVNLPSRPAWEYQQCWLAVTTFVEEANALGKEGWELIQAEPKNRDTHRQDEQGQRELVWVVGWNCIWKRRAPGGS